MNTPWGDDGVDDDPDTCEHGVTFDEDCERCEPEAFDDDPDLFDDED